MCQRERRSTPGRSVVLLRRTRFALFDTRFVAVMTAEQRLLCATSRVDTTSTMFLFLCRVQGMIIFLQATIMNEPFAHLSHVRQLEGFRWCPVHMKQVYFIRQFAGDKVFHKGLVGLEMSSVRKIVGVVGVKYLDAEPVIGNMLR